MISHLFQVVKRFFKKRVQLLVYKNARIFWTVEDAGHYMGHINFVGIYLPGCPQKRTITVCKTGGETPPLHRKAQKSIVGESLGAPENERIQPHKRSTRHPEIFIVKENRRPTVACFQHNSILLLC